MSLRRENETNNGINLRIYRVHSFDGGNLATVILDLVDVSKIKKENKMIDWNSIKEKAHGMAVEKGWWEKDRSDEELTMLMITEIAEATEEVRNRKPPVYVVYLDQVVIPTKDDKQWHHVQEVDDSHTILKPEGEIVELVDTAIRICDWAGKRGVDLYRSGEARENAMKEIKTKDKTQLNPLEFHFELVKLLAEGTYDSKVTVLYAIEMYSEWFGVDFTQALESKLEYNSTRPARHGGKAH